MSGHYVFVVSMSKKKLLHLLGSLLGCVKNKSRSSKNLLKLKNLVEIGVVNLQVTNNSTGNLTDDVGKDLTISGSRKVPTIKIYNFSLTGMSFHVFLNLILSCSKKML